MFCCAWWWMCKYPKKLNPSLESAPAVQVRVESRSRLAKFISAGSTGGETHLWARKLRIRDTPQTISGWGWFCRTGEQETVLIHPQGQLYFRFATCNKKQQAEMEGVEVRARSPEEPRCWEDFQRGLARSLTDNTGPKEREQVCFVNGFEKFWKLFFSLTRRPWHIETLRVHTGRK